jgi:hypothetical protein
MLETLDEQIKKEEPRPQSFFTLLVLSYIGNGLWILFLLVAFSMLDKLIDAMEAIFVDVPMDVARRALALTLGAFIATCVGSIIGLILMSKRKRVGFWVYAVSNGIFALMVFANLGNGQLQPIIIGLASVGFIIGFSKHLKWMN